MAAVSCDAGIFEKRLRAVVRSPRWMASRAACRFSVAPASAAAAWLDVSAGRASRAATEGAAGVCACLTAVSKCSRAASLFVGPERAGSLCARLAGGRYDALSGWFLGIDDDLDELLNRTDEIVARELYTLRIQV